MSEPANQELWRSIFAEGDPKLKSFQQFHRRLPSPPRCKMCFAPFAGIGGLLMRVRGKGRNRRNPNFCDACDKFLQAFPDGAEVVLSLIFVDVRGSVKLAEHMTPTEFSCKTGDFYARAARELIDTDGFILEAVGDHVVGVYPPGFSGARHAHKCILAAQELLHSMDLRLSNQTLPIGIGVHTGKVFIGTTVAGEAGAQDIHVFGDSVNVAARLAELAQAGEALITESAWRTAGLNVEHLSTRLIEMKGRTEPVSVIAIRDEPAITLH
jgi:adenylate cyclase